MKNLKNIISHYRSCYAAESSAISLLNFFGSKTRHTIELSEARLLEVVSALVPISTEWGEKTEKDLQIYSKEKALYCGSFFLSGKATIIGKSQRVIAPLFLHPVELTKEDGVYFVQISSEAIINPSFINCLSTGNNDRSRIYEQLSEELPTGNIGFEEHFNLEKTLAKHFPNLDLSEIENYPKLTDLASLKKSKSKENSFKVVAGIGLCMLDKATNTRGILNELEEMANRNDFSAPIQELFFPTSKKLNNKKNALVIPASLSVPQQNILQKAFQYNQTLVVGPPGTGKSFTIATLAAHAMSQGKSVLIASKNSQAVNVVGDKIEQDLGLKDIVVRASNRDYRRFLKANLKDILSGQYRKNSDPAEYRNLRLKRRFYKLNKQLSKLEDQISKRLKIEQERGYFLDTNNQGLYSKIKGWLLERDRNKEVPLSSLLLSLNQLLLQKNNFTRVFLRAIYSEGLESTFSLFSRGRKNYNLFLKGLKARQGNKKEALFNEVNFKIIFKAFPIWIVNTTDVHYVLPFKKELFDLVIIDEATQCDTASCLPLLQRAKHSIIVGDPKQLRHISFLSKAQQRQLAAQNGLENFDFDKLNYREKSLLDLSSESIENQEQVNFLDEHYRSKPDIISFSNKHFYSDSLRIMTSTPITAEEKNVHLHQIKGKRGANGKNKIEADTLLEDVEKIIQSEVNKSADFCQSIGILSPFREQVNYLQQEAEKRFSIEQLERHKILVGTPHSFQGEEKNLMFLSFAVDNDTHPSTFLYINRPDVFNVSVTRARSVQHIYLSIEANKINNKNLLAKYIEHFSTNQKQISAAQNLEIKDTFFQEVLDFLESKNIKDFHKTYSIAGVDIDFLFIRNGKMYGIDLIGNPKNYETPISLEQYKILQRSGVVIFPLPYSLWQIKRELCQKYLLKFLEVKNAS